MKRALVVATLIVSHYLLAGDSIEPYISHLTEKYERATRGPDIVDYSYKPSKYLSFRECNENLSSDHYYADPQLKSALTAVQALNPNNEKQSTQDCNNLTDILNRTTSSLRYICGFAEDVTGNPPLIEQLKSLPTAGSNYEEVLRKVRAGFHKREFPTLRVSRGDAVDQSLVAGEDLAKTLPKFIKKYGLRPVADLIKRRVITSCANRSHNKT